MDLSDIEHPLLKRQLAKHLNDSENLDEFIHAVHDTYKHHDSQIDLLERTMMVSNEEIYEANKRLKNDLEIQKSTIEKLNEALSKLGIKEFEKDGDLLRLAKFVNKTIQNKIDAELAQKQSESKLRSIIDSALDAVIVMDQKGKITEWNDRAARIFGWNKEDAIGAQLSELIIPVEQREAHKRGMSHFLKTGKGPVLNRRIELEALHKNGHHFPVELSIIPNKVEGVYFFSSFIRDLTEQKQSEKLLKAINDLAISLLGKNDIEDIAWEIAKKTIEKIGLEDCVIYIVDEQNEVLEQVAAYGPKNPKGREIANKSSVNFGEGIVGKVAATGRPVMVNDTSKDPTYIAEDMTRMSELAVPIIDDGKVIGVIDSEHHEKNFYTDEHIIALTTISNITSTQIRNALNTQKRIEAEKSLKESEERWQSLIVNQPEAVQISRKGVVLYINPAGLRLYDADSLDEVVGLNLAEMAPDEHKKILKKRLDQLHKTGKVEPLEFSITTLKGNKKYIEANSAAIHYNGEFAVQTVLRDITEKKKAENEIIQVSSRLYTLLNNLNSGVLMEGPERAVVHSNKRFCELFGGGFTPEDIFGQDCGGLLDQAKVYFKDPNEFQRLTDELIENKEKLLNQELELNNGLIYERDFIPIYHGNTYLGNVWQYRDITEKKQAEIELVRALESERSYNELNSNFVSMVSHEFRTPLTSIHSTAELLLQFGDRFTSEELSKRVDRIYNSAKKMDKLIQDVLTVGKLESDNTVTEPKEFVFSDVLNEMIHILRSSVLNERDINVELIGSQDPVYYDLNLIELILRNLLENAGKYSEPDTPIEIEFRTNQKGLTFSFRDYGIGIPEHELDSVFESFKRGSNTENIKGTGLGLPIVKKAIERMNGTVNVVSEVNKETTITVHLPKTID